MTPDQAVRNTLATYLKVKQARCAMRPRGDVGQMVHLAWADGEYASADISDRSHLYGAIVELRARREDVPVAWVAHLGDVYGLTTPYEDPAEAEANMSRGDATRAYRADNPDAWQALVVVVVDSEGNLRGADQKYRYDDAGQPKFGPVRFRDWQITGEIPDQLRKALGVEP